MSTRAFKKLLRLESLEARLPLAFDVSLTGSAVQFNGSPGNDTLTLSVAPGNFLQHNIPIGGNLVSPLDMDSTTAGEQSIDLNSIGSLQVYAGPGNDNVNASLLTIGVFLYGDSGNDTLRGGSGSDDIRGGNDNDTLEGNGGDDFLEWYDQSQSLGNDILRGGAGNDFLLGGSLDQFFGGADFDNAFAYDLTNAVLTDTTFTSSSIVSSNHSVEDWDLRGTGGADTIDATAWTLSGLLMFGFGGNDILRGGSGSDDIRGGDDNDTLEGNGGDDFLEWYDQSQSLGNDILRGGAGNDFLLGGSLDQFFGGADFDNGFAYDLTNVVLTDTTFTSSSIVSSNHSIEDWDLRGTDTADTIDASAWTLSGLLMFGFGGNDILRGGSQSDDIRGGDDNDTLEGNGGDDFLEWFDQSQSLGNDILRGGAGNDFLLGGSLDQFFGGADFDNAYAYDLTDAVLTDTTYTSSSIISNNHSIEDWELRGTSGADTIDASAWTLSGLLMFGFGGNDILRGGSLGDDIRGGDDNDTLEGNGGDDFLEFNDLFQSFGNDILRGGAGNDFLLGGNLDQFFGGADFDNAYAYDLTNAVLTDTTYTSSSIISNNHSIEDWELRGTSGADTIDATAWTLSGLLMFGFGGNDILRGGSLGDDIRGGDDNDTLEGNGGDDFLEWNDFFQSFGSDILRGGAGNDFLLGGNLDQFFGGADFDNAYAYDLTDAVLTDTTYTSSSIISNNHSIEDWELRGTSGADTIDATAWTLSGLLMFGFGGNDILRGGSLGDDIRGGDDNDTLEGNGGDDFLDWNDFFQSFGNDILRGGAGNDLLAGNEGNDTLEGGANDDTLSGGNGDDVYVFDTDTNLGTDSISEESSLADSLDFSSTTTLGIVINLGLTTPQVVNANLTLVLGSDTAIENVLGGALADQLSGSPFANQLAGGPGDDTYFFDTDVSQGSDTVSEQPSAGFDTINFIQTTTLGVAFNLGLLTEQTVNANQSITLASLGVIESVIGGFLSDTLTGDSFNNTLNGANGDDTLNGGAGDDTLTGSAGADTLIGGANNDRYIFDADSNLGSDTLIELTGGGIDLLNFGATTTLGVTVSLNTSALQTVNANLQLSLNSASTFENIVGGEQNDRLTGNSLANTLQGNSGLDIITGLGGDDLLRGNAGNDSFMFDADSPLGIDTLQDVEGGTDTLNFAATTTLGVAVDLSRTAVQVVNANLQLALGGATQFENVIGGSLGDTLRGNANANVLTGGPGDDRYVFDADSNQGSDTVVESSSGGTDTLDFSLTSNFRISLNLGTVAPQTLNTNLSLTLPTTNTVENVIGGSQPDTILGNSLANRIDGRSGDDNLNGAGGNDLLIGGGGLDTLVGGPGDDTMRGGIGDDIFRFKTDTPMGSDSIEELAAEGKDRLNFDSTFTQSVIVDLGLTTPQIVNSNLTLTLNAADTLESATGGSLDDTITGNTLNNNLIGGPGNDLLLGLGGNDLLQGGTGNDLLEGGVGLDRLEGNSGDDVYRFDADTPLGSDTVTESLGEGNDLIDFGATTTVGIVFNLSLSTTQVAAPGSWVRLTGDLEIEKLIGTARNDTLTGNSLSNVIVGAAGNDTLQGLDGRDLIIGGTGLDTLFGGNGEDLLIGDSLSYYSETSQQLDRPSIDAVMLEWTRTNLPFASRILNLKFGGGLNGAARVNVTTVLTDAVLDQLQGDLDLDWFWISGTDLALDLNSGGLETVN